MFYCLVTSLNFAFKWFSIVHSFARLATERFVWQTRCWTKMFDRLAAGLMQYFFSPTHKLLLLAALDLVSPRSEST